MTAVLHPSPMSLHIRVVHVERSMPSSVYARACLLTPPRSFVAGVSSRLGRRWAAACGGRPPERIHRMAQPCGCFPQAQARGNARGGSSGREGALRRRRGPATSSARVAGAGGSEHLVSPTSDDARGPHMRGGDIYFIYVFIVLRILHVDAVAVPIITKESDSTLTQTSPGFYPQKRDRAQNNVLHKTIYFNNRIPWSLTPFTFLG